MLHDASMDLMTAPVNTYIDEDFNGYSLSTVDGSALEPSLSTGALGSSTVVTTPAPDTTTVPENGSISTYTVQSGDNLSSIASHYDVSINTILWANNITDPSTIKPGTKLVILPVSGVQHTVRAGETLSSIAQKFGADASDIAQFNGISANRALQAGDTIIVPGGELSSAGGSSSKSSGASGSSSSSSKSSSKSSSSSSSSSSSTHSSSSVSHGSLSCDDASGNPCHGIGGASLSGFFSNPLPGALVTQGLHGWDAVDLAASAGTSIKAAAGGTVILSRMGGWNGGYGNYVIIDNGSGVETLYAHMSSIQATVGESVSAGQVIGGVGRTGDATGDHLHFEVRGARNPFAYCHEDESDGSCFGG